MSNMARLVREQVGRVMSNFRHAFRGTAARNTHGVLIGIEMEGLAGESISGELMQHYGYSSAPLPGAEFLAIPVGGNSKHAVVIASEDGRYRVKLKDGEVAVYTDEGDIIHMKRGRLIEIETDTLIVKAQTKVRFETPLIEQTGDIKADGDVADRKRSMQEDRDLYNAHDHGGGPKPSPLQ
ncbi:phage baseplate assembly protein [Pseudomonas shahriarae]|uniref:phage baseplate assembly protein domain-containing protein n=1 Tax=Pseudomonas shahriarae TaxID=2745512 RepID=UPI0021C8E05F|nr:phage baseplate assembly protein [Pseudomonas shahriarae]MCU0213328.1 phage baseplate assembly protein [Pseudomonas shahriarae]